ncbi:hypothetical protein A3840_13325 [Devosia elaeis]|uniref:Uncharacterized protein n=1 Tax=Devosia elaeis TaxID=1770058 RepID=A0A178HTD6_9HYPH|nr:hypothetical protein A3840_13325 [Devosia elaeis]
MAAFFVWGAGLGEKRTPEDLMVSLSNHEVGDAGTATTSPFDRLRMRSTDGERPAKAQLEPP